MKKLLSGCCVYGAAALSIHGAIAGPPADEATHALHSGTGLVQSPLVYDAAGKAVGSFGVRGFGLDGSVILQIEEALIRANLTRAYQGEGLDATLLRWMETDGRILHDLPWSSSDCSGVAYIPLEAVAWAGGDTDIGLRAAVFARGSSGDVTAYVAGVGSSSVQTAQSLQDPETGACRQSTATVNAWPAEKAVNLSAQYPEPLAVRYEASSRGAGTAGRLSDRP